MSFQRGFLCVLVLAAAVTAGGCREEGDVQIASIHFNGVEQIDEGALKGALQTRKARGSRGGGNDTSTVAPSRRI